MTPTYNDSEEIPRLLQTEGLTINFVKVGMAHIPETADAFRGTADANNFLDLCGSLAAHHGDCWREDFEAIVGPQIHETNYWLRGALTTWPADRDRMVAERNQAEQTARGILVDTMKASVRNAVEIEMGEKNPPKPAPLPARPVYQEPILETELSATELRERQLTQQVIENRIRATGEAHGHIETHEHDSRIKFGVAAGNTGILGYLEFLMGFDITGAALDGAGSFAVSLAITIGTNILSIFAAERFHHVLSYWGAKLTFNKLYPGGIEPKTKRLVDTKPESPDMMTWLVGLGGTILLVTCLIVLAVLREHLITRNEYLAGTEIAVYMMIALVIIGFFAELRFTNPRPRRFALKELELTEKLKTAQAAADLEKTARDERNRTLTNQARTTYSDAMRRYEATVEESKQPAPDPIEIAKAEYAETLAAATEPLNTTVANIESSIAHRAQLMHEYREARQKIVLPGYASTVSFLLDTIEDNERINLDRFTEKDSATRISDLIKTECDLALEDPELDRMVAEFNPAVPPVDTMTEVENLLEKYHDEERERIINRRTEEENKLRAAREEQEKLEKVQRQEAARKNLRIPRARINFT